MKPAARKLFYVAIFLAAGAGVFYFFAGDVWRVVRPTLHKEKINKYAAMYKMDPLFLMAVVRVESSFKDDALSHRGAIGLMQLMPDTAREMARKAGRSVKESDWHDPDVNIHLGVEYLSQLRESFPGDVTAQLAAYNAGPANVRSWKKGPTLEIADIQFPETREFVRRVQETQKWLKKIQKVKNVVDA